MQDITLPIWIVLISYRQIDDVKRVTSALSEQTQKPAGIVLVDNASNDGTMEFVRANYPDVIVIDGGANLGFAVANNVGVRYAIEQSAEWVLLLNSDTEPSPSFLADFWSAAEANPGYAAYHPLITYGDGETVWACGGKLNPVTMLPKQLYEGRNAAEITVKAEAIEYATGCAFLVKTDIWTRTGGFWEAFFMYYEDAELCLRIRELDEKIAFVSDAKLIHHTPKTLAQKFTSPNTAYYLARNRLMMIFYYGKNKPFGFIRAFIGDAIMTLAMIIKQRNHDAAYAVLDAWEDFLAKRSGIRT